ncbi:unnamed protein product [Cunninghamella blakesleeana]
MPIGYYIKQFYFCIDNGLILTVDALSALINLCPFIEKVNDLPKVENGGTLTNTIYWKKLKRVPISYSIIDERWIQQSKKDNKIVAIGIDVELTQQLYLKPIERRQRRIIYERFPRDDYRSWVDGKYITFPSLTNLRDLYLDFGLYNKKNKTVAFYQFDQDTLQSLSESCPSLVSLKLAHFNFNYFTPNNNSNDNNTNNNIVSFEYLEKLDFEGCFFYDPNCYNYLLKKCPKLTALRLYLWLTPMTRDNTNQFKQAIYQMITGLDDLKILKIQYMYYCSDCYNHKCSKYHYIKDQQFWPHQELLLWLTNQPKQLTTFQYPFDLFTIERDTNNLDSFIKELDENKPTNKVLTNDQQRAYLKKLTSLTLQFDYKPSYTLDYIHYLYIPRGTNVGQQAYNKIKHLNLFSNTKQYNFYDRKSHIQLQIYDWMNISTQLKTLTIKRVWIQNQMGKSMITDFYVHQKHSYFRELRELHIEECFLGFHINDLTQLILMSPKLTILKLKNILFRTNVEGESFSILALCTHFDELYISNIKYEIYTHDTYNTYRNENTINHLTVKQSSSSSLSSLKTVTYDKSMNVVSQPINPLIVECQYVNNLQFS